MRAFMVVALLSSLISFLGVGDAAEVGWKPTKPIVVVLPSGYGSANHIIFEPIRVALEKLGYTCAFLTKPGADGVVATNWFLENKGDPDNPWLLIYSDGQYGAAFRIHSDVIKYRPYDFEIVSILGTSSLAIVTPRQGLSTLGQIVETMKRRKATNTGRATLSLVGVSSPTQPFMWEMLAKTVGLEHSIEFVRYQSPSSQLPDVIGGRLQIGTAPLPAVLYFSGVEKGFNTVAISGESRFPGLPEVPTITETFPKFKPIISDWAVVLPKGVKPEILRFYVETLRGILLSSETQDYFRANAYFVGANDLGPDAYKKRIARVRREVYGLDLDKN